jgi:hypothetical protein
MTDFLYFCPNCYVCYIRRKDGEYDTGTEFYRGEMPRAGEIIKLVVRSETMKGRVGVVTVPRWMSLRGDPVIQLYVDEI